MTTIIFILALLVMPITAFIVGANLIGIVFVTFYVIFGFYEWYFKRKCGVTVSQDTWKLTPQKKVWLTAAMVLGWAALICHLWRLL